MRNQVVFSKFSSPLTVLLFSLNNVFLKSGRQVLCVFSVCALLFVSMGGLAQESCV